MATTQSGQCKRTLTYLLVFIHTNPESYGGQQSGCTYSAIQNITSPHTPPVHATARVGVLLTASTVICSYSGLTVHPTSSYSIKRRRRTTCHSLMASRKSLRLVRLNGPRLTQPASSPSSPSTHSHSLSSAPTNRQAYPLYPSYPFTATPLLHHPSPPPRARQSFFCDNQGAHTICDGQESMFAISYDGPGKTVTSDTMIFNHHLGLRRSQVRCPS